MTTKEALCAVQDTVDTLTALIATEYNPDDVLTLSETLVTRVNELWMTLVHPAVRISTQKPTQP